MGTLLVYIIKSSICLAVFYLFYRLLLSKETFHRINRIGLLSILLLSFIIPFIEFTVSSPTELHNQFISIEDYIIMNHNTVITDSLDNDVQFGWSTFILLLYLLGILFFFIRNIYSIINMLLLVNKSSRIRMENGEVLILHNKDIAPFSWLKFIVMSRKDYDENGTEILTHELAHIHKVHSIDLLVADICIFFQWFNPAAWLLKQELQNIHEYEADEEVLNQGIDAKKYQMLLIKKAVGTRLYSMANSFNHNSLKKRIGMMIKRKSNPWARMKYLYVLPVTVIAVTAFARPEISKEFDEISIVKVSDLTSIAENIEVKSVESQPKSDVKVHGTVISNHTGKPIVGANVIIGGTTKGTISDKKGEFTLDVPVGKTLFVSFVGMNSKQIKIKGEMNSLKVVLSEEVVNIDENSINDAKTSVTPNDPTFMVVESMPQYPGGMGECLKFLAENIKYPIEAKNKGIQGRVIVEFVVRKDGKIINPTIVRGIDEQLDAEALRVVNIMPEWTPGTQRGEAVNVKYTVPIKFSLDKKTDNKASVIKMENITSNKKPLFIVNGEKKSSDEINSIDGNNIESISVIKDPAEIIKKYGFEAKDGVVIINLKKS